MTKSFYIEPCWDTSPFLDWLRTGEYKDVDSKVNGLVYPDVCTLCYKDYGLEIKAWDEDEDYIGINKVSGKLKLEYVFNYPIYECIDGKLKTTDCNEYDDRILEDKVDINLFVGENWKENLAKEMFKILKKYINKKEAEARKDFGIEYNPPKTKIVLVSGCAQHGKDTFAGITRDLLEKEEKKTLIIHYADLLKFICTKFFGWNGEKDDAGRALLQTVGTDVIRAKDPDYWVNFVIKMLGFFEDEFEYVIIPDLRFPNEYDRMFEAGYDVTHVHVIRPDFDNGLTEDQKNHPSENDMGNYNVDYTVVNDGDIEALSRKAVIIVTALLKEN